MPLSYCPAVQTHYDLDLPYCVTTGSRICDART